MFYYKSVKASYEKHDIEATNHWFKAAKLFIDGKLVATNNDVFALDKKQVKMKALIHIDGAEHMVEVFAWAPLISVLIKICVDGKQIGGDAF
jgi:hypothetical protein